MRHVWHRASAWLLLTVPALSLHAAGLSGGVVDPAGLPVPGAVVTLVCADGDRSALTDVEGRFHFAANAGEAPCEISVVHPRFGGYRKTVGAVETLMVHLELATLKQVLTVAEKQREDSPLAQSTVSSVSLTEDQLKVVSNSTGDLLRYAKLLAGVSGGPDAIYVDGLPSGTLPAAQMIAGVSVNANPFSAEYSDGDQTRIEIITRSPDRQLRMSFGGASLSTGGANPLAAETAAKSNSGNWNVSGPVPLLPLAFSAQASLGSSVAPIPIEAIPPPALFAGEPWQSGVASSSSHNAAASANLYFYPTETVHAHVSYSESVFGASNVGAGGLVLPEAGSRSRLLSRNLLAALRKSWHSLLFSGGLVYSGTTANSRANSNTLGVTIAGAFTAGGAAITDSTNEHTTWTWKAVVQSESRRAWTAGLTVGRVDDAIQQVPNASGNLQFENTGAYMDTLNGQSSGTWFVARGNGSVRYTDLAASPFFQKQLQNSSNFVVTAGIRFDYQSGYGVIPSPRLSAATQWHKFVFRSGGGLFVHNLPENVLLGIVENDGQHIQQFLAEGVSFSNFGSVPLLAQDTIRSQFAAGLTRPRQFMQKTSIERPLGSFAAAVEYTWIRGEHLLGSRRLWSENSWLDLLESDRDSVMHRLHTLLSYKLKAQRLAAYYDWTNSRDDTGGPLSFPADQNDIRTEWARSAGVPRHSFTSAAMLQLPGNLSANVTESWHGSTPYNITTGLDVENDGLYTDRGGRLRNSGNGPGYNSLALYVSRRIALPVPALRGRLRIFVRLGLQGENLLGNRNYTSVGSIIGSPVFGMPLSALPGRAVRLWANLD